MMRRRPHRTPPWVRAIAAHRRLTRAMRVCVLASRVLILLLCLLLALLARRAGAQPRIDSVYRAEVGVREATGRNDGARVEEYLGACGLPGGHPWCAAFVAWCHQQAGRPTPPGAAWSPSWFPPARVIYARGGARGDGRWQAGDVFGIYYPRLGRVGHVGFVDSCAGQGWVITVEGNTNAEGGREGQGVHRRRRSRRAIHSVSRWQ